MKVTLHADPVDEKKDGKEKDKEPDDWEKDNWVRTVTDAHAIMNDPKKMKHVRPRLKKQHAAMGKAISSTAQLRQKAKEMEGSPKEEAGESKAEEAAEGETH